MSMDIRLPNITGATDHEQLVQIRSYLYQFAGQLQWALSTLESGAAVSGGNTYRSISDYGEGSGNKEQTSNFNQIKSLKEIKKMAEDSKVAVRNVRRDTLDTLKKMKNAKEITDDEYAGFEAQVEKLTTKNVEIIDKAQQEKEKELMTV